MVDNKRKKFHDKDKYYRLAKEQGLRSRAAFKLSQINRKYNFLQSATAGVIDLCAAPGGWTQIVCQTCTAATPVIAVDILPIRPIARSSSSSTGSAKVTTLIGDITTSKTQAEIARSVREFSSTNNNGRNVSGKVSVVLHDGAPNIGADYSRDAYLQNELALSALKTATQHLVPGGTFVTKIYRSRDFVSYTWVCQQLFDTVHTYKPTASRQQSAEIFLICSGYLAPTKSLDPKLLDPKYVFESVEGDTTGGDGGDGAVTDFVSILDKNYTKHRRQRNGYNHDHFDFGMKHIESVCEFVDTTLQSAVQLLSTSTAMKFSCPQCDPDTTEQEGSTKSCCCKYIETHPLTSIEIKECCSDLKVLNRTDFKEILKWRTKMQECIKLQQAAETDDDGDKKKKTTKTDNTDTSEDDSDLDSDEEEEQVQKEIEHLRHQRQREAKKKLKKERVAAAKRRKAAALGMDLNAIDIHSNETAGQDQQIFNLKTITNPNDLHTIVTNVNLDTQTEKDIFGGQRDEDDDDDDVIVGRVDSDDDDTNEQQQKKRRQERDLDEAYELYLNTTKDGLAKSTSKHAKRSKRVQRQKVLEELTQDEEMVADTAETAMDYDARAYAQLLQGNTGNDSDDDDSSESEDDGFHDTPMTPKEAAAKKAAAKKSKEDDDDKSNPLLHTIADNETTLVKTARWFSNPMFTKLGNSAAAVEVASDNDDDDDDDDDSEDDEHVPMNDTEKKKNNTTKNKKTNDTTKEQKINKKTNKKNSDKITAEDVLAAMPKTDKEIRHVKRLKRMARDERKRERKAKKAGEEDGGFKLVAGMDDDDDDDIVLSASDQALVGMSDHQKKKVLAARELIKAGFGAGTADDTNSKVEIVSRDAQQLPTMDPRQYNSDNEDYDSDDYAQTLALGTMLLRRSKEKAFADASYNRFAWNDPNDLPEWFVDDEKRHYRPQLPIPPELVAKMKEKMMALSTRPIAKVAEARARKSKRARDKLASAKKKAEAVANSSDMTEAMKLKAISKALRHGENKSSRPGKTYVVAKKNGAGTGGGKRGAKVVDKRLKSDKRSMERVDRKRKKGKQNGMVGSKKRRNHK